MGVCTRIVGLFKHLLRVTAHPQLLVVVLWAPMGACLGHYSIATINIKKDFADQTNHKNLTPRNFFTQIFFTWKFPDLWYVCATSKFGDDLVNHHPPLQWAPPPPQHPQIPPAQHQRQAKHHHHNVLVSPYMEDETYMYKLHYLHVFCLGKVRFPFFPSHFLVRNQRRTDIGIAAVQRRSIAVLLWLTVQIKADSCLI